MPLYNQRWVWNEVIKTIILIDNWYYYLVYYELHNDIRLAIEREKRIKGWTRIKKDELISSFNPEWKFLNDEVLSS